MTDNDTHQPTEEKRRDRMRAMAGVIDRFLNGDKRGHDRDIGFVLFVFRLNSDEGRFNYISNAKREDIITLMKEQIAKFERDMEKKP